MFRAGGGAAPLSTGNERDLFHSIQFKFICIAPFTIQSLQSSFTGN